MQPKTFLALILSGLIVALIGSVILFFVTSFSSYILFSLFFLLAATVAATVLGKIIVLKIRVKGGNYIGLHVFLMMSSITLMILQLANIYIAMVNAILYVIVLIFALGFFTLNILKFKPSYSRIEYVALAYPLSMASLAIIGTIMVIIPSNLRGIATLATVTFLSVISLSVIRSEKETNVNKHSEIIIKNGELILVITLILFIVFFVAIYPELANFPGLDISRNFLYALSFSKDSLGNFYYMNTASPLFSAYQSSMIYIIKPSVQVFQATAISLNIFAILSFYAMASQYLKRYGDHTPAIATLIWSTFAGFGWLSFITNKINNPQSSLISLIGQADVFSYGDITWRRNFFYLSMEASFALVFGVLYFLKRRDLSNTNQVLLMTLLMTPIPLMHEYGVFLLLPVLLCFAAVYSQELKQQLQNAAYSLIIASFAGLFLNYILNIKAPTIPIDILPFSGFILTGLAILAITFLLGRVPRKHSVIIKKLSGSKCTLLLLTLLTLLFLVSLLLWLGRNIIFNFNSLDIFGYVPIFLYPVKLGIACILAIAAVYIISTNFRFHSKELVAFLASVLLLIFVSLILSIMQMGYVSEFTFNPNSWLSGFIRMNILNFRAERMFEIFKIPIAILASIALGEYFVTKTKLVKSSLLKYFAVFGLISLILISGMASTCLGFEYYCNQTQTNPLSSSELNIINTMQNDIYANGKATIISPQTPTSCLDFTGATTIATESTAAWTSESPELPLFVTRYSETTPTFLYLNKVLDYPALNDYAGNYLAHLTNVTSTYLENSEVQIKEINNTSVPTPNSNTALIVPYDTSTMSVTPPLYQQEENQYTIASLFFQPGLQSVNSYPKPINYSNVQINETASFNGLDSYIRINGTQTSFNKLTIDFAFQPLNLTEDQVIVAKLDWGNPLQKSWEIVQYGKSLVFKISSDGSNETDVSTRDILQLNTEYAVQCEYDGASMQIFINNNLIAAKAYQNGIFATNTDITIGAELYDNRPTSFANMLLKDITILNDIPQVTEPVFDVYDFLSSMGLNYTTILSDDSNIGSYATLILPYDDVTTQQMLTQLEDSAQKNNIRNVAIINTNGYGPLLNLFGNETSETFNANQIFAGQNYTMQPAIEVPKISPNKNTTTEAQYINNNSSSPLVLTITQDQLTLIYINIYPLLSQNQLLNPTPLQSLTKTLTNYIGLYNETTVSPWFSEPSLLFTNLKANGTINISSNSLVFNHTSRKPNAKYKQL